MYLLIIFYFCDSHVLILFLIIFIACLRLMKLCKFQHYYLETHNHFHIDIQQRILYTKKRVSSLSTDGDEGKKWRFVKDTSLSLGKGKLLPWARTSHKALRKLSSQGKGGIASLYIYTYIGSERKCSESHVEGHS